MAGNIRSRAFASFAWSILLFASAVSLASSAQAAIIRVPADQPTIQAGIDAATSFDTVLVAPGTYSGPGNRDLRFDGQDRVILSEQGAAATVIDAAAGQGGLPGRAFNLTLVGAATTIAGFTIQGGDSRTLPPSGAGGGVLLLVSAPTFRECVFRANRAEDGLGGGGGAVACINSSARFENCRFLDNVVEGVVAIGGAVKCYASSTPFFQACQFEGNRVRTEGGPLTAAGGAFIAMDYAAPVLEDCTFTGNSSDTEAGAVFSGFYSLPTLRRCLIRENTAHTGGGADLQGTVTIEDCDFIANAAQYGGGLELSADVRMVVTRSRFTGNSAAVEGGGLRIAGAAPLIEECVFTGNQCPFGGALQLYDAAATLTRCTLAGNSSGIMVGREGGRPANLTMSNSIISASTEGAAVRCSAGSSAHLTCCDVFGNAGGDWAGCIAGQGGTSGNFSLDPCFCDPPGGDFTLGAASPCAPPNSPPGCGLVGALPVMCTILCPGTTAIGPGLEPTTWGRVKALHR